MNIANPTYDTAFKQIFGHDGMTCNNIGPKIRLISFLKSILKINITEIEYLHLTQEIPNQKKNIFYFFFKIKNKNKIIN